MTTMDLRHWCGLSCQSCHVDAIVLHAVVCQAAIIQNGVLPDAPALEGDDEEDKAPLVAVFGDKASVCFGDRGLCAMLPLFNP